MTAELATQLDRQQIVLALLYAAENPARVIEVCATAETSGDELTRTLADACGLSMFQADVILTMQVRRFSPHAVTQMRAELLDIDQAIDRLKG